MQMISVSKEYCALSGGGGSTIRLYAGDYKSMRPGDVVEVRHIQPSSVPSEAKRAAEAPSHLDLAVEFLTVASMVIGKLSFLAEEHSTRHPAQTQLDLQAFYPDARSDDLFVAIYFA